MSEQTPGDASSAFKARLDALRSKGPPPAAPAPSLKERLQQGAPPMGPSSPEDLKARIQSRFQKSPRRLPLFLARTHPVPLLILPLLLLFNLKKQELGSRKPQEEKTDLWSFEQGGVCPSCQTFNLAGVVFCGSCSYMLLETEKEVIVITSYPLKDIKGLAHTFVNKLAELNIRSTEDVLRVCSNRKQRHDFQTNRFVRTIDFALGAHIRYLQSSLYGA